MVSCVHSRTDELFTAGLAYKHKMLSVRDLNAHFYTFKQMMKKKVENSNSRLAAMTTIIKYKETESKTSDTGNDFEMIC